MLKQFQVGKRYFNTNWNKNSPVCSEGRLCSFVGQNYAVIEKEQGGKECGAWLVSVEDYNFWCILPPKPRTGTAFIWEEPNGTRHPMNRAVTKRDFAYYKSFPITWTEVVDDFGDQSP